MSPHGRRRPGVRLGLELRYAARPRARRGPGGEIARPFPGRRQGEPRERRGPGRRWRRGRGAAGARLRPEVRAPRGGGSARVQPGPCAPALFAAGWGRRRLAERPEMRGGGGSARGAKSQRGFSPRNTLLPVPPLGREAAGESESLPPEISPSPGSRSGPSLPDGEPNRKNREMRRPAAMVCRGVPRTPLSVRTA